MKEKTRKPSLLLLKNFIREYIKEPDVNIRIGWRQFRKNMMIFYRKRKESSTGRMNMWGMILNA